MTTRMTSPERVRLTRRGLARFTAGFCVVAALTACGRKPNTLEPPEGADESRYPRDYPPE